MTFRVLVSMRIVSGGDGYTEIRDAISHDWIRYLQKRDWDIILLPNLVINIPKFLDAVNPNALILTGGDDYGVNFDRDKTELQAVRWFQGHDRPVLGVCRGMQILNIYYGGSVVPVSSAVHNNRSLHCIDLLHTGFVDWLGQEQAVTNSYHNYGITPDRLAPAFIAAARCDRVVEAIVHGKERVVGIQWHPERETPESRLDQGLFRSLENRYIDLGYSP